jgi:hypothetical protein
MLKLLSDNPWIVPWANDLDAFIPEVWAQESLIVLENAMVMANLVHRDFEDEIAQFGDTVNTRLPASFEAKRKVDGDEVTIQDASATNVPVVLNQHIHTSFRIRDGEESKGFKSLRDFYLVPALSSIAQAIDEVLIGEKYNFIATSGGKLGTAITRTQVLEVVQKMDEAKIPAQGRNLVISPAQKGGILNVEEFLTAEKRGDEGTALREASIGRLLGLDTFMSQNCRTIASGNTVRTGLVNLSAGYAAGSTSIASDGWSSSPVAGEWITIAGDMTPQLITAITSALTMTISPGLKYAVVNDAAITAYDAGAVNQAVAPTGYAAGYSKTIVTDAFTVAPKLGQLVSFGVDGYKYAGMSTPTTTAILLNRALDAAIADNALVGIGPAGNFGFAFMKNALALVSRPLAPPAPGTGALSYTANYNNIAIRVTITYEGLLQAHLVTVDLLCGVKTLDTSLGCLFYS